MNSNIQFYVERNFKEAKRLKEEGDLLIAEGVANQKKLENLKQQLIQESSNLEEAQSENTKLGEVLREKECQAGLTRLCNYKKYGCLRNRDSSDR